jgi:hypothetical protein
MVAIFQAILKRHPLLPWLNRFEFSDFTTFAVRRICAMVIT